MGKKLTQDEWHATKPPFKWIKLKMDLQEIQFDFIEKWLTECTSGWWYMSKGGNQEHTYVFQYDEDCIMFKLWSINNPFKEDYCEI